MGGGADRMVADFGLGSRGNHGALTYRAVDVTVTLCLHAAIAAMPFVLRWLPVPARVRAAAR